MAHAVERNEVAEKYRWNLTDLYPSETEWTAAKKSVADRIPKLAEFQGHLGESAAKLHAALVAVMDVDRDLSRVATYASQLSDEDARISKHLEMRQSAEQIAVQFHAAIAYVRPEILAIGADKMRSFIAGEPRLRPYQPYLEDILRRAPHTLSTAEEKVAAQAGLMSERRRHRARPVHERRDALPGDHALERREGPARRPGLHQVSRAAEPGRSRIGVPRLLGQASASSRARSAPRSSRRSRRTSSTGRSTSSTAASRPRCSVTTSRSACTPN